MLCYIIALVEASANHVGKSSTAWFMSVFRVDEHKSTSHALRQGAAQFYETLYRCALSYVWHQILRSLTGQVRFFLIGLKSHAIGSVVFGWH